ncbi:hypothetical protein ACC712_38620, partial [Rhizobium ruizarguesonis]
MVVLFQRLAHACEIGGDVAIVNGAARRLSHFENAWHESVNEIDLLRTILEDLPVAAFVRDEKHRL